MLIGVDDMDVFKGIELKLQAVERVLDHHPEWRGRLVLLQVTNAPRCAPPPPPLWKPYTSPACIAQLARPRGAAAGHQCAAVGLRNCTTYWRTPVRDGREHGKFLSEVHTWCQYVVRPAWGTCISCQCARNCLPIVASGTESWRLSCCSAWLSFWLCLLFQHGCLFGSCLLYQTENEVRAGRRSTGKDIAELHDYCAELVAQINAKYATPSYTPVVWLERPVRGPPRAPGVGCRVGVVQHQLQTATKNPFLIFAFGRGVSEGPACHASLRKAHLPCLDALVD